MSDELSFREKQALLDAAWRKRQAYKREQQAARESRAARSKKRFYTYADATHDRERDHHD
jgi:hypothetical protein